MDLVNLASASGYSIIPPGWPRLIVLVILVVALILGTLYVIIMLPERLHRGPDFEGPALAGTAQIVSTEKIGKGGLRGTPYRITLRVEIAGYQPYEVIVKQFVPVREVYSDTRWGARETFFSSLYHWAAWGRAAKIVAVQADSTNPQRVRIDFSQPMPLPQAGSFDGPQPPLEPPHGPGIRILQKAWLWALVAWLAGFVILVVVLETAQHYR